MRLSRHVVSQIVFYLGWVGMIIAETTLWSLTGLVFGFLVFTIGGIIWAKWHIANTDESPLHGPVLVGIDRMMAWNPHLAFIPSAFLGGGPGVGLVMKKQGSDLAFKFSVAASLFYAGLWATIHAIRPEVGVPIEAWPSAHFIRNIWHMTIGG